MLAISIGSAGQVGVPYNPVLQPSTFNLQPDPQGHQKTTDWNEYKDEAKVKQARADRRRSPDGPRPAGALLKQSQFEQFPLLPIDVHDPTRVVGLCKGESLGEIPGQFQSDRGLTPVHALNGCRCQA